MKIQSVSVRNFRSLEGFDLQVNGESVFVIGENAGGKTSLLTAVARALGRDRNFTRADFRDLDKPVDIEVTLTEFDKPQRGLYGNYIEFGPVPELAIGVRAIWDADAEEAAVEHWYPRHVGSRSKREEREGVPLQWLPSGRDAGRMLRFGLSRNLMDRVLADLPIGPSLERAVSDVEQASAKLAQDVSLLMLLSQARDKLAKLLPEVAPDAFGMGIAAVTGSDLLREFELTVQHLGDPVSVSRQSSGVSQLAIFVFAVQLAETCPGIIMLIDEPEISLHPQSQRALMRLLRQLDAQVIVATHSSNLLDRADPRRVIRLKCDAAGAVVVAKPLTITEDEARKLARVTSPQTAEAFFSRAVILVEGPSDQYAVELLAERRGRNLDAEGVSVVPVHGAASFGTYMGLFGPAGFDLSVSALCDEAEERHFRRALERLGHTIGDRTDMEEYGFFVCVADLEDELVRAIGTTNVVEVIDQAGDLDEFGALQGQLKYRSASLDEQVRAFLRSNKVEYAPLLVARLDLDAVPRPLSEVMNSV